MDSGKEIEVDPDPERGLKWIRIRQNAVDPDGSETLFLRQVIRGAIGSLQLAIISEGRKNKRTEKSLRARKQE